MDMVLFPDQLLDRDHQHVQTGNKTKRSRHTDTKCPAMAPSVMEHS